MSDRPIFEVHEDPGTDRRIQCSACENSTYHRELSHASIVHQDDESETRLYSDYYILACQGCDGVRFLHRSHFSEHYDIDERGHSVPLTDSKLYPPAEGPHAEIDDALTLPHGVYQIYKETIAAHNAQLPVVAGMGMRAIVEAVCQEQGASGQTLQDRIESLGAYGLISHVEGDILHSIRHLGNRAAHEVLAHTTPELSIALGVVEHLLNAVYILPQKAKHLPKKQERETGSG